MDNTVPDDKAESGAVDQSESRIPGWPSSPRRLKTFGLLGVADVVGDIVLTTLSFSFSGLALAAWFLHGQPTRDNVIGLRVEKISRLGPTVFPLLFAAVLGRSLRVVGRYWVGKGIRLGVLESLLASQSVWSTIESQLMLRRASWVTCFLLLIWCLSPLGGQASLRVLHRVHGANTTTLQLRYASTGPASAMVASIVAASNGNAIFGATLTPSNQLRSRHQDLWGNVRVPLIEALNATAAGDGWVPVPPVMAADDFSSLLGIHVVGLPLGRETDFNFESTYLKVDCEPFVQVPCSPNITRDDVAKLSDLMKFNFTATAQARLLPGMPAFSGSGTLDVDYASVVRTFFFDADRFALREREKAFLGLSNNASAHDGDISARRRLIFGSRYLGARAGNDKDILSLTNCSLSQTAVESAVHCPVEGSCRVVRMRRSRIDRRPTSLTFFDHTTLRLYITRFLPVTLGGKGDVSSPVELFLNGSSPVGSGPNAVRYFDPFVDLSRLPAQTFSRRLSLILNTYYLAAAAHLSYGADLPSDLTAYGAARQPATDVDQFRPPAPRNASAAAAAGQGPQERGRHPDADYAALLRAVNQSLWDGMPYVGAAASSAAAVERTQRYACHYGWFAVLLLASGVLGAAGAAALLALRPRTLVPDVLKYVASATYANPHFAGVVPPGASTLDAVQRARLLYNVRVRVADVRGDDAAVGEVAFVAGDGGAKAQPLQRRRLYL